MEQIIDVLTDSSCGTMFSEYPDVVGVDEITRMLGVSRKQVYKILRKGRIAVIRCDRSYKAAKVSVIKYVLQGAQTQVT